MRSYILLDRRYCLEHNTTNKKLKWNIEFSPMTNTLGGNEYSNALCNVGDNLRNIKAIKISNFVLNIDPTYLNGQQIITILIDEFASQSYISQRRFHFIGRLTPLASGMHASYIVEFDNRIQGTGYYENNNRRSNNTGIYHFNKIYNQLSSITVSFGDLQNIIPLYADQMSFAYDMISMGVITFSSAHNIPSSITSRVYITGFNTNQPITDAELIRKINSLDGVIATYLTTTTLTLTTLLGETIPVRFGAQDAGAICYMEYHRVFIPLEFIM